MLLAHHFMTNRAVKCLLTNVVVWTINSFVHYFPMCWLEMALQFGCGFVHGVADVARENPLDQLTKQALTQPF